MDLSNETITKEKSISEIYLILSTDRLRSAY